MMLLLASYVQLESGGVQEIIESAGFEVQDAHTRTAHGSEIPQLVSGQPADGTGAVKLSWNRVDTASAFIVQISDDGGANWIICGGSTKASLIIRGLKEHAKPWFRVAAISPAGLSDWSDAVQGKAS